MSRNCRTLRISCSSSSTVTDQTQQSSFNDAELKLIDALIGIQGRGKSASPKQLNVCKNFKLSLIFRRVYDLRDSLL